MMRGVRMEGGWRRFAFRGTREEGPDSGTSGSREVKWLIGNGDRDATLVGDGDGHEKPALP